MTSGQAAAFPVPIFVINMPRDVERRRHITGLLDGLGLAAEFVTAVDGRLLTAADRAAYDRDRALRIYGVEMKDSEIGCFLSHYRIYQRMVADSIDMALILEDDVSIESVLPQVVRDVLACGYADWLVIRLDTKRGKVSQPPSAKFLGTRVAELPGGAALYRLRTQVLGVGATLIRREGAVRMLEYGKQIFMPIDQTMDRYWENGILPYVVRPFPVNQGDDFGSHSGDRSSARRRAQPLGVRLRRRLQRIEDAFRKRAFNLFRSFPPPLAGGAGGGVPRGITRVVATPPPGLLPPKR